jgi:hypothetical protein
MKKYKYINFVDSNSDYFSEGYLYKIMQHYFIIGSLLDKKLFT